MRECSSRPLFPLKSKINSREKELKPITSRKKVSINNLGNVELVVENAKKKQGMSKTVVKII